MTSVSNREILKNGADLSTKSTNRLIANLVLCTKCRKYNCTVSSTLDVCERCVEETKEIQ